MTKVTKNFVTAVVDSRDALLPQTHVSFSFEIRRFLTFEEKMDVNEVPDVQKKSSGIKKKPNKLKKTSSKTVKVTRKDKNKFIPKPNQVVLVKIVGKSVTWPAVVLGRYYI